ncbi:MAG: hypothetical protein NTX82_02965 [Candidatus Parcubacteria bacterium]|nr:hypothetical protein [Candidatus Parcubacteria bacterium]
MFPGKCVICQGETGQFFIMQKGKELKGEVCPSCKEKLEKKGWKVVGNGMH